jgi:hypothetical protein
MHSAADIMDLTAGIAADGSTNVCFVWVREPFGTAASPSAARSEAAATSFVQRAQLPISRRRDMYDGGYGKTMHEPPAV